MVIEISIISPCTSCTTLVPEVFFLFFFPKEIKSKPRSGDNESPKRRGKRKTSGYLGLKSHFHADDSCQTRQIANKKSDQWQFSKHVLISRYFFKWG